MGKFQSSVIGSNKSYIHTWTNIVSVKILGIVLDKNHIKKKKTSLLTCTGKHSSLKLICPLSDIKLL